MFKRGHVVSRSHNHRDTHSVSGFAGNARSIASSGVRAHTLAAARGAVALRKLPASAVRAVSSTVYVSREMNHSFVRSFVRQSRVHPRGFTKSIGEHGGSCIIRARIDRPGRGFPRVSRGVSRGAMRWEIIRSTRRVVFRHRSGRASYLDSSRHCSGWVREECVFFSDEAFHESGRGSRRVGNSDKWGLAYINTRITNKC